MTSRIANIIEKKKAYPNQILAVTFTNKAAKEMELRVSKILGSAAVGLSWLGTFHSICAKFLRKHESDHMFGVGFECLKQNIDIKKGIKLIRSSATIYPLNLLRINFLGVFLLSLLPNIFLKTLLALLSFLFQWNDQKSLDDYYS